MEQGETTSAGSDEATATQFLFTKKFDALQDQPGLSNELNGTCLLGQLLMQGYEQHLTNGKHFREAYISSPDPRLNLGYKDFDNIYFRSDNEQRTMLSGETVLKGFLEEEMLAYFAETNEYPNLVLHTADKSQDIMDFNFDICPLLQQYQEEFLASEELKNFSSSQ